MGVARGLARRNESESESERAGFTRLPSAHESRKPTTKNDESARQDRRCRRALGGTLDTLDRDRAQWHRRVRAPSASPRPAPRRRRRPTDRRRRRRRRPALSSRPAQPPSRPRRRRPSPFALSPRNPSSRPTILSRWTRVPPILLRYVPVFLSRLNKLHYIISSLI